MSYCEHKEDETIDNLLGNPNAGFWIDVGAHMWWHENTTRMFYERGNGWSGINIEPLRRHYDGLVQNRPRDINLNVACGAQAGFLTLYDGDGLTSAVEGIAHTDWPKVEVPMLTLTSICESYVKDKTIDFCKVDVEMFEKEVLLGMDFSKYRPKVLCIEATIPMSQTPCYQDWQPIVLNADYIFVHMDYNNRYYTRKEGW